MKCPKCNIKLYDKCCPRCGYLENGNKVSLKDKPEKYIDEKILIIILISYIETKIGLCQHYWEEYILLFINVYLHLFL